MTKPSYFLSVLATIPAVCVSASISYAATNHTCKMEGGTPIKPLEEFKRVFMTADAKALARHFAAPLQETALKTALEQYHTIIGPSKVSCMTLLQRVDDGGLTQEISRMAPTTGGATVFLYTLSYPTPDRDHALHFFHYSTDLRDVMRMLH